jgi:hypothetical protein
MTIPGEISMALDNQPTDGGDTATNDGSPWARGFRDLPPVL